MRALGLAAAAAIAIAACGDNIHEAPPPPDAPPPPPDAPAPGGPDPFPENAIAFYLATACPDGWEPYDAARGRTIVPVAAGADVGATVGAALGRNEQRGHDHVIPVEVELASHSYVGVAGGGNSGVTRQGLFQANAPTDRVTAGLPYAQLLICRKAEPPRAAVVPKGLVAFFDAEACPLGWRPVASAQGRMLVGLPAGGAPGAAFGGAPLAPGEDRGHHHEVAATLATVAHGIALASGCCGGGFGARRDYAMTVTSADASAGMPYLQLLACEKD